MPDPTEGSERARAQAVIAVALVVAVVAGVFAVLGIRKHSRDSDSAGTPSGTVATAAADATTAVAEGGQLAVDFTSFNYQTLNHDLTATASHATATFAKTYLNQSRAVASLIRKAKAVSVSQVVATGLQSYNPTAGTASVLVALNDTTKNTQSPAGTVQYFRMQVQMVKQNGTWLATAVTPQ
jgi:Mce-associated membrane protein